MSLANSAWRSGRPAWPPSSVAGPPAQPSRQAKAPAARSTVKSAVWQGARLRSSHATVARPLPAAPVVRPARRPARHRRSARPEVQRRAGDRPGHRRSPVQQERRGRAADRVDHQADDRAGRHRSRAAAGRSRSRSPRTTSTPRSDSRSRLRVGTAADAAARLLHLALMSSENRAAHALGPALSGRHARLRRGDEPQGTRARHERHALRRAHRPVEPTTSRAPAIWRCWSRRPTQHPVHARALDLARAPGARSASGSCSSATPTAWCAARRGRSACRRPATSPRPAAAS